MASDRAASSPHHPERKIMQVLLHTDPKTDGSHQMAEHLKTVVSDAMARFGERVTRVEAHLSDVNSQAKASGDGIHCTLEARLVGQEPVVVKNHAANAHEAIEGAVRKLRRAVETEVGRHDPRHARAPALPQALDDAGN
jgi:ribosome-associated translation inhibitor RaiA